MHKEIKKWETTDSEFIGDFKIFNLFYKTRINPNTNLSNKFTVAEPPNWVNIIALTTNQEIILVEQFRHGIDNLSLELPAGIVEEFEDTRVAAERECIEETGYIGNGTAQLLGKTRPNPAFFSNYCFHYLWTNCELKRTQNLDENEDIRVVLYPLKEVNKLIEHGKLQHTLTLSALMFYNIKKQTSQI